MRRMFPILILLSSAAFAETEPSAYDRIWDLLRLYESEQNRFIQYFDIKGRYQLDAVAFRSGEGTYEDIAGRRFRIGFKAGLFRDFVIHSEVDLDRGEDDTGEVSIDTRLTDSYIGWMKSEALNLKLGKQSAPFTLDGATSSTKLLVPERSVVAENMWFPTEYFTGAGGYGIANRWNWRAGAYSASGEPEFGHFESGWFGLLSLGRGNDDLRSFRIDYVYNEPDFTGGYPPGTRNLEHVLSVVYKQRVKQFGLWYDITAAKGLAGQGDLAGVTFMPFYNFSDRFQGVAQYGGVVSLEGQSDVRMGRYPSKVNDGDTVESTHNLLLGFNWFFYGHKLKWQNAVEYNYGSNLASNGDDYHGYGFTSALRISW